jgi:hypothetical protein
MSAVRVIYSLGIGWGGHTSHIHAKNAGGVRWSGAPPAFDTPYIQHIQTPRHTPNTSHYIQFREFWVVGWTKGGVGIHLTCMQPGAFESKTHITCSTYIHQDTFRTQHITYNSGGVWGGGAPPAFDTKTHVTYTYIHQDTHHIHHGVGVRSNNTYVHMDICTHMCIYF